MIRAAFISLCVALFMLATGLSKAEESKHAIGALAFCTTPDLVKAIFSEPSVEAALALTREFEDAGVCVAPVEGVAFPAYVVVVGGEHRAGWAKDAKRFIVRIELVGYEDEPVYWSLDDEASASARKTLRGV